MGNKASGTSSIASSVPCQFCGVSLRDMIKKESGNELCQRCGGVVKKRKKTRFSIERFDKEEENKGEEKGTPILRLHVLPFQETLADSKLKEDQLIKDYILPYLRSKRSVIKAGDRFQYKEIDFKIISCNPPEGYYNDDTKVRTFGQPVSALANVTKLHCLPVKSTIPDYKTESKRYTSHYIFQQYVKPYFSSETRHIVEGDFFIQDGIQFKIIACDPKSGEVRADCRIFTDGEPLDDLKKAHILPIYESLPLAEQKITESQILEKYLIPWLAGRFRYFSKDDEFNINGVDFKVVSAEPSNGIVTNLTQIFANGEPIKQADIKSQRMQSDEEMARRLQEQENTPSPIVVLQSRLQDVLRGMPSNDPHRPLIQRLHTSLGAPVVIQSGGGLDPTFVSLLAVLGSAQMGGGGDPSNAAAETHDIESLPTRTYQPKKQTTTTTTGTEKDKKVSEEDDIAATCRICLSDYEAGEEMRTLPCFHSYHKTCIDTWLQRNRKCPICKNPITS